MICWPSCDNSFNIFLQLSYIGWSHVKGSETNVSVHYGIAVKPVHGNDADRQRSGSKLCPDVLDKLHFSVCKIKLSVNCIHTVRKLTVIADLCG